MIIATKRVSKVFFSYCDIVVSFLGEVFYRFMGFAMTATFFFAAVIACSWHVENPPSP